MVAPVTHCAYTRAEENTVVGERNVGDARWDYDELVYAWFDHWLKGEQNGITDSLPKVRYYTMGSNEWSASEAWPPEGAETLTMYLGSESGANTLSGDGVLTTEVPVSDAASDSFTYDPMDPVVSHGGNVCCTGGAIQAGSFDQQQIEASRQDVLVYTTAPFDEGLEVSGTIGVTLYVSSDARDTDFTVKLLDVYPDGTAYNLDETIQRARYRDGYDRQVFMEPGQVYEVEVSPMSTSNYFAPGHSLRIEVSSSNFPRFTRNLNTGGNNYDETVGVAANNQVHHFGRVSIADPDPGDAPVSDHSQATTFLIGLAALALARARQTRRPRRHLRSRTRMPPASRRRNASSRSATCTAICPPLGQPSGWPARSTRWIGGRVGELVIVQTGDILDRGDEEEAIFHLLEKLRLEAEARAAQFMYSTVITS